MCFGGSTGVTSKNGFHWQINLETLWRNKFSDPLIYLMCILLFKRDNSMHLYFKCISPKNTLFPWSIYHKMQVLKKCTFVCRNLRLLKLRFKDTSLKTNLKSGIQDNKLTWNLFENQLKVFNDFSILHTLSNGSYCFILQ